MEFVFKIRAFLGGLLRVMPVFVEEYWKRFKEAEADYRKNNESGRLFVLYLIIAPILAIPFVVFLVVIFILDALAFLLVSVFYVLVLVLLSFTAFFVFPYTNYYSHEPAKYFSLKMIGLGTVPMKALWVNYTGNIALARKLYVEAEDEEDKYLGIISGVALVYAFLQLFAIVVSVELFFVIVTVLISPFALLVYLLETFVGMFRRK